MKFIAHNKIRMYDTDTAQILFFGNQFRLLNDALEDLLENEGITLKDLFTTSPFGFVFVHAESDYLAPLVGGDHVQIEVSVNHIGNSSFGFYYEIFKKGSRELVGKGNTKHVTIDRKSFKKITIPADFRKKLTKYT
jgi:YbgC/YbaW family acyl-CoA thioester hydrolase